MKHTLLFLLILSTLASLFMSPACSTTEEALVYDITGTWQFTVMVRDLPQLRNFTFSGTTTTGVASDLTRGLTGIYTVNNTMVEIVLNDWDSVCLNITRYYTGSFTATTAMSGEYDAEYEGSCMSVPGITWTATKL